jgi:cytochrome o ubiquinol oxidase subunit 1
MTGLGLIGAFLTLIAFAFRDQEEVEIPAVQVAQFEARRQAEVTP